MYRKNCISQAKNKSYEWKTKIDVLTFFLVKYILVQKRYKNGFFFKVPSIIMESVFYKLFIRVLVFDLNLRRSV